MDASSTSPLRSTRTSRPVDSVALDRVVSRMLQAASAPWLHAEVAHRMAQRLAIVKARPRVVLDWSSRLGGGVAALRSAYASQGHHPDIRCVEPVSPPPQTLEVTEPWWSTARWRRAAPALVPGQVVPGSAQLIWSNMALHLMADPALAIQAWHRCLAIDGFLMFSTLGPGSLPELRSIYASRCWGPAMAPLVDMHDLGDMLVDAGFADPVMDQEQITLTWETAEAALVELRTLGANLDPERFTGLRTPGWKAQLLSFLRALARQRTDGRLALTFEIAYGHAFRPAARVRLAPEARLGLADFRAMTRTPRS